MKRRTIIRSALVMAITLSMAGTAFAAEETDQTSSPDTQFTAKIEI